MCLGADTRGGAYKRVVWYLVTDSIAIKKAAVEKYGERVLTDVSYVPAHIQDHTARWGRNGYRDDTSLQTCEHDVRAHGQMQWQILHAACRCKVCQ
jgi:hypothetical protein